MEKANRQGLETLWIANEAKRADRRNQGGRLSNPTRPGRLDEISGSGRKMQPSGRGVETLFGKAVILRGRRRV